MSVQTFIAEETSPAERARLAALERCDVVGTPPEEVFDELVKLAHLLVGTRFAAMNLVTEDRTWTKAGVGVPHGLETPRSEPFCGRAITTPDEITIIPDTAAQPELADSMLGRAGVRFYAGAPLVTAEGHALGTLCVSDVEPRELTPGQVDGLRTLARAISAQLELRMQVEESREQAVTFQRLASRDALTGAANRRALDHALGHAISLAARSGEPLAVLMMDLDHFKAYNDTHGHAAGDTLLRECVARWSTVIREGDLLARYGGEEFVVVAPRCPGGDAQALAERLRAAVPDGATCSIGTTVWERGDAAEDLLARADRLLYEAKAGGRDLVCCG